MLKTSVIQRRKWFTSVSHKLERVLVMMRIRDQWMISKTTTREVMIYQIVRWAMIRD